MRQPHRSKHQQHGASGKKRQDRRHSQCPSGINQGIAADAATDSTAAKSTSHRRQHLRHLGDQLAALETLRHELHQLAVRLKVEAVALSDMQRDAAAESAGSAAASQRSLTTTDGFFTTAASVSTGGASASAGASSSAFWDDARSVATTALTSATTRSSFVDTDSEVDDTDDWGAAAGRDYQNAVAYVSGLMDADSADCSGEASSGSSEDSLCDL